MTDVRESEGADREAELAARERELEERERQLARADARLQAAIVAQKEQLHTREQEARDVQKRRAELAAERTQLQELARELEQRERRVREAERGVPGLVPLAAQTDDAQIAEREHALAERERRLEERLAGVTRRERALAAAFARQRAPAGDGAAPPGVAPGSSTRNLLTLERLVDREARTDPERADERRTYLMALREYANYDGNIPVSFDVLIDEVFGDLVAGAGPAA